MSYWVYLEDDQGVVEVSRHWEGGTYALGGTTLAELDVTYNYGPLISKYLPEGLRDLHGKTAGDTIIPLHNAVAQLGTERHPDYWAATPGNAGYALAILLGWAQQHPNAVWRVS